MATEADTIDSAPGSLNPSLPVCPHLHRLTPILSHTSLPWTRKRAPNHLSPPAVLIEGLMQATMLYV